MSQPWSEELTTFATKLAAEIEDRGKAGGISAVSSPVAQAIRRVLAQGTATIPRWAYCNFEGKGCGWNGPIGDLFDFCDCDQCPNCGTTSIKIGEP